MVDISEGELSKLIPYTDNNQAISVGFNTADSVREIKQMLLSIFNPKFIKEEKQHEESKKIADKINQTLSDNKEIQRKSIENNNEYIKRLQAVSDETKKAIEEFKGYGVSFLDIATKAYSNYMQDTVKLANVFRDIESSGIIIQQGFDSLGATASSLGMTYDELASHLKKTSPLIAKLNSSYKDGVDIFRKSIRNISDDYNMTHDEQVAAFNAALEELTPSQLRQMSEQQLIATVDETAKQMKLLSLATGKSVENIKQENDIKAQSIRVAAWRRNNKQEFQILSALGLDSAEMLDYILSGGTRVTGDLYTKIAGDKYLQAALPDIMNMIQSGQLNIDSIRYLQQQYGNLALQRINEVNANTKNRALFAGSSASNKMENYIYYDEASQRLSSINFEALQNKLNSEERERDSGLLSGLRDMREAQNMRDTELLRAKTGSTEGMTRAMNLYSIPNKLFGNIVGGINNGLQSLGLSGMTSGMLTSIISTSGSSLFAYSVSKFSKAVDRFTGTNSAMNKGFLESLTSPTSRTGRFVRRANNWASNIPVIGRFIKTPLRSFGTGVGVSAAGSVLNYLADKYMDDGLLKTSTEYISSALGNAGTGAMLGSMFGPIGTIIGGLGGAAYGAISQYIENSAKEQYQSQMKPSAYSDINHDIVIRNALDEQALNQYQLSKETLNILKNIERHSESSANTSYQTRMDKNLAGNKNNSSNIYQD